MAILFLIDLGFDSLDQIFCFSYAGRPDDRRATADEEARLLQLG